MFQNVVRLSEYAFLLTIVNVGMTLFKAGKYVVCRVSAIYRIKLIYNAVFVLCSAVLHFVCYPLPLGSMVYLAHHSSNNACAVKDIDTSNLYS